MAGDLFFEKNKNPKNNKFYCGQTFFKMEEINGLNSYRDNGNKPWEENMDTHISNHISRMKLAHYRTFILPVLVAQSDTLFKQLHCWFFPRLKQAFVI